MNIAQAKVEIANTVKAYLLKGENGDYRMPMMRQRPIFLVGPPGIGKTAIMEQIAREQKLGLVSYTMTHHTRQSAIGLPFIVKHQYGGREYSVTEYTMSEIIASVYDWMEETGQLEGILFLDEMNCVSETLAPAMLQFLQNKTFGNHRLPKGWVIIAAGNPPEYNKSVRELDIVTLDRLKKISVEEDLGAFKEYAYRQGIHGGILSFLELKPDSFYQIQSTLEGKRFATARGWEDLSQLIQVYEELGIPIGEEVVEGYIQHPQIARDFSNYLCLYGSYRDAYSVKEILAGKAIGEEERKLGQASFDERMSVLYILLDQLFQMLRQVYETELYIESLYQELVLIKEVLFNLESEKQRQPAAVLEDRGQELEIQLEEKKRNSLLDKEEEKAMFQTSYRLKKYGRNLRLKQIATGPKAFVCIKEQFGQEEAGRKKQVLAAGDALEYGFSYVEEVLGQSQEMVIFVTELTANFYSMKFISEYGCKSYFKYNKELLFYEEERELVKEIKELNRNMGSWDGLE